MSLADYDNMMKIYGSQAYEWIGAENNNVCDLNADGTLVPEQINIDRISRSALPGFSATHSYGFETSVEGWTHGNISPNFSAPDAYRHNGALTLESVDLSCFGYWSSQLHTLAPDTIHRAVFTVPSNVESPVDSPTLRLRVNSIGEDLYWFYNVDSPGEATCSPSTTPAEYEVYFHIPLELYNAGVGDVYCSMDLINFGHDDDPHGTLNLENMRIEKEQPSSQPLE